MSCRPTVVVLRSESISKATESLLSTTTVGLQREDRLSAKQSPLTKTMYQYDVTREAILALQVILTDQYDGYFSISRTINRLKVPKRHFHTYLNSSTGVDRISYA